MDYDLYFNYDSQLALFPYERFYSIFEDIYGSIFYDNSTDEEVEENPDYEGEKIGVAHLVYINQALAKAQHTNMSDLPFLRMQYNSKALMELNHENITPETIAEIGPASNPNILLLQHFGISAAWRKKGIAQQALKGIIKQMKGKCGYMMVLHPEPAQCSERNMASYYETQGIDMAGLETDPEKAQWKLNAFFQRCGFKQFRHYENVFICNVEQVAVEPVLREKSML